MNQSVINEIWRSIDGYTNYQESNVGRVRNATTGKMLKPRYRGKNRNYHAVALYKDGKQTKYSVHRLVAQEFIPNPHNKPQVDHIDGNKENNANTNLRWATNSENQINNVSSNTKTSVYKGVSLHSQTGKWTVNIGYNNTTKHIGCFTDEIQAAKAYDEQARVLF